MELTPQQIGDIRTQNEISDRLAVLSGWKDHRPMKVNKRQKPLPIPPSVVHSAPVAPVSCISGKGAGGGMGLI